MRSESAYLRRFKNPYRRAYEMYACGLWLCCSVYVLSLHWLGIMPDSYILLLFCAGMAMACLRFAEGWTILHKRSLLSGYRVSFMSFQELKRLTKPNELAIGFGFVWTPEHSQKLYELSKIDPAKLMLGPKLLKLMGRAKEAQPKGEIGCPWLHGVDNQEILLSKVNKIFEGGTLLIGTTQAGKGVMLAFLISQALIQGKCVIVIDPKSSPRLFDNLRAGCRLAGRPEPLYFHPAFPKESIRVDPVKTYDNPGEIASRVVAVMPPDSDGAFASFAWSAVYTVVSAMVDLGEQPSLRKLAQHLDAGIEPLLKRLLQEHLDKFNRDPQWKEKAKEFVTKNLDNMTETQVDMALKVSWYEHVMEKAYSSRTIESALKVHHHSKEHYAKLTASLMPILAMLTSGSLEKLLSPDPDDIEDDRPITDFSTIIENNQVVHLCLDSLSNPAVATALGAIFLADIAAIAGARYNLRQNDRQIALFVDEASNVINQPMIEILNKGAEGGMHTTCAMQTIADLAHRLGSENAARMVLGNLNNLIALRSKDRPTQDFITETFGKTYISQVDTTLNSNASTAPSAPSFDAGASHKRTSARDEIIPSEYLGRLPNCQFFASVAGGFLFKGRVPILVDEKELEP